MDVSRFKSLWFIGCLFFSTFETAFADQSKNPGFYARRWGEGVPSVVIEANRSYLDDTRLHPFSPFEVLDVPQILKYRQELEDLNRSYEMKESYGVVSHGEVMAHSSQISDFSKNLMSEIRRHQIKLKRKEFDSLLNELKNSDFGHAVEAPVAVMVTAASIYFGKSVDIPLSSTSTLSARAEIVSQNAQFSLNSPFLTGFFGYIGRAPASRDSGTTVPPDPLSRSDERYKVSVSKLLPWLDVLTDFSYFGTTHLVSASLSKQIFPHLVCVLDSFYPLGPESSDVKVSGESLKLLYGVRF